MLFVLILYVLKLNRMNKNHVSLRLVKSLKTDFSVAEKSQIFDIKHES